MTPPLLPAWPLGLPASLLLVQLDAQSSRVVMHDALQLSSEHLATQVVFVSSQLLTHTVLLLPVWLTVGFSTLAVQPKKLDDNAKRIGAAVISLVISISP